MVLTIHVNKIKSFQGFTLQYFERFYKRLIDNDFQGLSESHRKCLEKMMAAYRLDILIINLKKPMVQQNKNCNP